MKSDQWKKDREHLRSLAREKPLGNEGTLIYCLISHMREKLHMRWYEKYHGGFSTTGRRDQKDIYVNEVPPEVRAAYTGLEKTFFYRCRLFDLSDQAAWIRWYLSRAQVSLAIREIATRVLDGYQEAEKEAAA